MIRKIICINSVLIVILTALFFVYPPVRAFLSMQDRALGQSGVSKAAWRLQRNLTPRYTAWARARVANGRAENLSIDNISGTEWPLFGSVFFLWAIENLQSAWDAGDHTPGVEPKAFSRDAIIAASDLVIDPKHAAWVKKHWGADYLHRENVFYRMLVIAALTSRERLLHDGAHLDLLRDQVETFAQELDASPSGLLDDYPAECYPGDVMAAIASIRRADAVLGTDHSRFANHALRAFIGSHSTRRQLPPYLADAKTGRPLSDARGCANSYMCLTAPELWPPQARQWYSIYDTLFWQERMTAAGYREFPKGSPKAEWMMDIDAGPVLAGYGVSASAFGLGAARKNGRFDRAYPLATEMLATVWELPNGVLAVPRLLSNVSDAPLLGEAGILWQLTIQPEKGFPVKTGGTVPIYVYIVLVSALLFGIWRILESIVVFRDARREPEPAVRAAGLQTVLWTCFMIGALATILTAFWWAGLIMLLLALVFPIKKRTKPKDDPDDWKPPPPRQATDAKQAEPNENAAPGQTDEGAALR
jgi:hypothetical protein